MQSQFSETADTESHFQLLHRSKETYYAITERVDRNFTNDRPLNIKKKRSYIKLMLAMFDIIEGKK